MGMFDSEVAADNRMREYDKLSRSAADKAVSRAGTVLAVVADVSGLGVIGGIARALGLAGYIRQLGVPTVEENLNHLGLATEDALSRVERKLEAQGKTVEEIQRRMESPEFKEAIAAAVLQTQRTKEKSRLDRLALIIANGVAVDDLETEGVDDMMRAAVELKESDISLLDAIYTSQKSLLEGVRRGPSPSKWYGDIQSVWREFVDSGKLNAQEHLSYRSSLSRLQSFGLIQQMPGAGIFGTGHEVYALLFEGKRFHERLKEITETAE